VPRFTNKEKKQVEKILCVDDEQNVLDAFQRQLRKQYNLVLVTNGGEALKILNAQGPFAVVVSDMNMPGMNGIQLLARAKELAPDTVRIMLTGAGDFQTAIDAVNEGNIFRFLAKPCAAESLAKALEAGMAQYRLIMAERELLEKTLKGSIQAMVDILALTNPVAFSRALRVRHYAAQMAKILNLPDIWQFEVAALLSQVGCVTLPSEVLEKAFAGESLTPQEMEMFDAHPQVGGQLLVNIPRLDKIAQMITRQQKPLSGLALPSKDDSSYIPEMGAHILKIVTDFDLLLSRGTSPEKAKGMLADKSSVYPTLLVEALAKVDTPKLEKTSRVVKVSELRNGMILAEDIRSHGGSLVVHKDQEVNDTLRQRLKNFVVQGTIPDQVRVFIYQRVVTAS
jgi:response regulator RpfG family c-di-GMP phosphodiesterase